MSSIHGVAMKCNEARESESSDIVSMQVGITPSGGHLLGPATGRPLPWL